jgi:ribosome-associated translation inhibitor RaiA
MTEDATLVIRFKDIEHDDDVHSHLESRLRQIAYDFPEASHCELSLTADALDITAHAQARGKRLDLASHAVTQDVRAAGERALDKLQRELRREHDKRIFGRRREARRDQERRRTAGA